MLFGWKIYTLLTSFQLLYLSITSSTFAWTTSFPILSFIFKMQQRSAVQWVLKTSWWHSNHRSCIWWSSSNHQRSIHPHYCQMLSSDDGSPSKRQIQNFVNRNRNTVFTNSAKERPVKNLCKKLAVPVSQSSVVVEIWKVTKVLAASTNDI